MSKKRSLLIFTCISLTICMAAVAFSADMPKSDEFTNSLGMKFVRVKAGSFQMGKSPGLLPFDMMPEDGGPGIRLDALRPGDFDEKPVHKVKITKPFYMGSYEVTNKEYELFDSQHKMLRGKDDKLNANDDDPVVNVSWYDAQAYCQWLSEKEGLPYRLPTEAEWEYACRAGTTTSFSTGDDYPKEMRNNQWLVRDDTYTVTTVGRFAPNPWGLYDMHGNVEEWCSDWYGPYVGKTQKDPVGYVDGNFRVTRGGSHSTYIIYLRSSNRMGAIPEDKNWLIGFRVVIGEAPKTKPLDMPELPLNQRDVVQRDPQSVKTPPNPDVPYFAKPKPFVVMPPESAGPVFALHNHDPAIVECPNGDLLACWYSGLAEKNRDLTQAGSRLVYGSDHWQQASPFWDTPDRNDHAPLMWYDDKDTIYHFSGMSFGSGYGKMLMIMRKSKDNGATWTKARTIGGNVHIKGHMPVEGAFRMHDGTIAITSDASPTLWFSSDEALTWQSCGGAIPGNHPGVCQLDNGNLFGLTRDEEIEGKMPIYESIDRGKTWAIRPSPFPTIHGGQRLVLIKLREGPIFFASFADNGIEITDAAGVKRSVRGLFVAVSTDDGKTWANTRLVSDDGPGMPVACMNGEMLTMSQRIGEWLGYMAGCQSTDGLIHLITSKTHYSFNLKWLMTPSAAITHPPLPLQPVVETFNGPKFDNDGWFDYKSYKGDFQPDGTFRIHADGRNSGINRIIGEGSFEANFVFKNLQPHPEGRRPRGPKGALIRFQDGYWAKQEFRIRATSMGHGEGRDVLYDKAPDIIKIKVTWDLPKKRFRLFYGFNGDEPTIETARSAAGMYLKERPFTEATSCYIMAANGGVDVDYFDIKPLE